jgi:hypothetical protein
MLKIKGKPLEEDTSPEVLGKSSPIELAPVLIPMTTYKALYEIASKNSCTVADVFSKAISEFISKQNKPPVKETQANNSDFTFRKTKK